MSAVKKSDINVSYGGGPILSNTLKSHANDPFFVKKAEEAKIAVEKLILPDSKKK